MEHDADELARWRDGDDAAGERLVARHHALVQRLCAAYRPQQATVEDLVQEAFLTMFARAARYRPQGKTPFAHWLSRLTVNACRDRLRAERRRPAQAAGDAVEGWVDWLQRGGAPPADTLAARDLVDRLLAELQPRDRLLLTLLDGEEHSVAEVAALTGWSQATVKVRAFRARRQLRAVAETLEERP